MRKIIVITGPTCVGKTKMSVELAHIYDAVILNADSMQVYTELNIGTAKIKEEEKENIPHFLFDIRSITSSYNIYDYQQEGRELLNKYYDKNIIIVGGSALYIKALLYDYKLNDNEVNYDLDNLTKEEAYKKLLELDKDTDIHINNVKRVKRTITKLLNEDKTVKTDTVLYDSIFIGLTTNRDLLYDKINNRVDVMIENGLLNEVENLYNKYENNLVLNSCIGYKELLRYYNNEITLEESINLIKQNSRRYAKRQFTFFNNQFDIKWFDVDYKEFNNTVNEVKTYIDTK